jgi:surface antigen
MRVTSLTGRLAAAAGALGIAALATGLAGPGLATAAVAAAGHPARVTGIPAGAKAAAAAAGAAIARAAIADAGHGPAAAAPAARARPAGVKLTLGQWPGRAGTRAAAKYYSYPYPHPPACTDGGACVADKWAFYRGQCTSWVAFRLNELNGIAFTNYYGGAGRWGDAVHWKKQATELKITVNTTPSPGAVAWYASTKPAPDGHVAYVEAVNSKTSFIMSEMNYDADNGFWVHTITKSTGDWPTAFIHFATVAPH